jgi:hypothetical protein
MIFVGIFEFKRQGKYDEAERLLEEMVALYEEWHEPVPASAYRQDLEAVRRKLVNPGPSDIINVADFPKATFATMVGIDHWTIEFDVKDKFAITLNDNKCVEGTFKVVKDNLELTDETGPGAEKGDRKSGSYKWRFADRKLTFTKIKDESDPRAAILTSGPWEIKE